LTETCCFDCCAAIAPALSGPVCCGEEEENLELMLFIHELLLPPVLLSSDAPRELDRPSMVGRFDCGFAPAVPLFAAGVGVEGAAGAVFFIGSEMVGGVTTAGE